MASDVSVLQILLFKSLARLTQHAVINDIIGKSHTLTCYIDQYARSHKLMP